ncbi:MAG: hypothetical protein AMXMBFR84_21120 [Candidatus Hydrogenedentota bacterium]
MGAWWMPASTLWADWMIQMAWQVAVLAVAVLLISRFAPRSSAAFRYALWALVFIKLIIPPGIAAPWSLGTAANHLAETTLPTYTAEEPLRIADWELRPAPETPQIASVESVEQHPITPQSVRWSIASIAFTVWGAVALMMFASLCVQYVRYRRRILRYGTPVSQPVMAVVSDCKSILGVRRAVRVFESETVSTPYVFGVFSPIILLPRGTEGKYGAAHLRNILLHELSHIRRHDIPMNWGMAVLVCLYWFHPAVWLAYRYIGREREMACDDLVLQHTQDNAKTYAETIVEVASEYRKPAVAAVGFVGLLELADNMLARVRSVGDATRTRRAGWRAALFVGFVTVLIMPMAVWTPTAFSADTPPDIDPVMESAEREISAHYAKADPEVQEYIRWTAKTFGRNGLWLPAEYFDEMSGVERAEKVDYLARALDGEYGRHLCDALNQAGVLADPKLLPGVLKAATYHRDDADYDCRPKWMAVAAVGRIGQISAVPDLVPLVDHGNQNTRMWARASLARLTGEYFGEDKKAWADWWNASHDPKISEDAIKPWQPPAVVEPAKAEAPSPKQSAAEVTITLTVDPSTTDSPVRIQIGELAVPDVRSLADEIAKVREKGDGMVIIRADREVPVETVTEVMDALKAAGVSNVSIATAVTNASPEIVSVVPAIGATEVDPATTEIRVTFDQDMAKGYSWTGGGDAYPNAHGKPSWVDARTCVLSVQLESGKYYRVGINSKSHKGFQGINGVPARNRVIYFVTAGASEDVKAMAAAPQVITMVPACGATDVPAATTTLVVTFDRPMGGGFSWVRLDGVQPEFQGQPTWNEDRTVATAPVSLKPGVTYTLGLNSPHVINFQSAAGVPLEPVVWSFTTAK